MNALELFDTNIHVAEKIVMKPLVYIPLFNRAALREQEAMMSELEAGNLTVKRNCHVRISNLPICPELTRVVLPKCQDVSRFLAVSGKIYSVRYLSLW